MLQQCSTAMGYASSALQQPTLLLAHLSSTSLALVSNRKPKQKFKKSIIYSLKYST